MEANSITQWKLDSALAATDSMQNGSQAELIVSLLAALPRYQAEGRHFLAPHFPTQEPDSKLRLPSFRFPSSIQHWRLPPPRLHSYPASLCFENRDLKQCPRFLLCSLSRRAEQDALESQIWYCYFSSHVSLRLHFRGLHASIRLTRQTSSTSKPSALATAFDKYYTCLWDGELPKSSRLTKLYSCSQSDSIRLSAVTPHCWYVSFKQPVLSWGHLMLCCSRMSLAVLTALTSCVLPSLTPLSSFPQSLPQADILQLLCHS